MEMDLWSIHGRMRSAGSEAASARHPSISHKSGDIFTIARPQLLQQQVTSRGVAGNAIAIPGSKRG